MKFIFPAAHEPDPPEAPLLSHLIQTVHGNRVVKPAAAETFVPGRRGVVTVRAGVQGDVAAAPPQINVEQVRVSGPVSESSAVHEGQARRGTQNGTASVVGPEVAPRRLGQGNFEGLRTEQPEKILVHGPGSNRLFPGTGMINVWITGL